MQLKKNSPQVEENREAIEHQISVMKDHLKDNPKDYKVMFALAIRHYFIDEYRHCLTICDKLAKLGAEQPDIYDLGGRAGIKAGEFDKTLEVLKLGSERFSDNYSIHILYATALNHVARYEEAEKVFKYAQSISGDEPSSYVALSNYYAQTGDVQKALEELHRGEERHPNSALILNNLGTLYSRLDDDIKASEFYIKALRVDPQNTNYLVNIGGSFSAMKKTDMALKFFDEALKINPDDGPALCSKAALLSNHGLSQEYMEMMRHGLESYGKRDELTNTNYLNHFSNYIFLLHYVPDTSRQYIFDEIVKWQKALCSDIPEKPAIEFGNDASKGRKLRIGMISKGFNVHPVGQMIYPALENLDKSQFELYCYTELAVGKRDHLTDKIYELCEKVESINNQTNPILVEKIRADEIDILIEMTGHSEGGRRLQLIAERAAPVQVKWVGGLFNTTGVPQMDWLLTDHIETPEGEEKWYTEKLYRMPDDYIVYYPPFYAPKVLDLPAKKNGYITFGNLNNLAKTNSYTIQIWAKILHAVPNSKLLLKGNKMNEDFVQDHLYKAFADQGIEKERVLIEGGEQHQQFLHVYNRIDIALDPHPYTGGLTTCEALWMGVPVVTLPGETFAGRHAASHLTNADMAGWIAKDEQDYIDIAVKWAQDIEGLSNLRAGLREHVAKTPLVDGPRYARNLENALRLMWGEWCDMKDGAEKPANISKPKPKKSKTSKKRK
ncbi:MAG: tetratricopeptide repeat protein [Alphaproteobacteria bacterium]